MSGMSEVPLYAMLVLLPRRLLKSQDAFEMLQLHRGNLHRLSWREVEYRYRGTSLTRKRNPLGPYRRPIPRVLPRSYETAPLPRVTIGP